MKLIRTDESKAGVVIGLPSHHGEMNEWTQRSLDALIATTHKEGHSLAVSKKYGSMLPHNRNGIVRKALELDATHVLFIDTDMAFESDALLRLLKWDRDVVSGLAVLKKKPFYPVAKRKNKDGVFEVIEPLDEGRFFSDLDGVGCAFTLIKIGVFEKLEKPYFAMPPYKGGVMGEDFYFCEKVKAAGYDICLDSSLIVGHVGDYVYTINDYYAFLEKEKEGTA